MREAREPGLGLGLEIGVDPPGRALGGTPAEAGTKTASTALKVRPG